MGTQDDMNKQNRQLSAFRLTETAKSLLVALADDTGLNQTGVVETAIREMAERRGLKPQAQPRNDSAPE